MPTQDNPEVKMTLDTLDTPSANENYREFQESKSMDYRILVPLFLKKVYLCKLESK